jgi:hypothetical protein
MSAEEAKGYGIIDNVIAHRADLVASPRKEPAAVL